MIPQLDFYKVQNWYPKLSVFALPTIFVFLNENEILALQEGNWENPDVAKEIVFRLGNAMQKFPFTRFIGVDLFAPTDTERFEEKRGAVCSAESAWKILCSSSKIRNSAKRNEVSAICVKPFRRMDPAREFRLFIKDGKLRAMSQLWLIRHLPNIVKKQDFYWTQAEEFVNRISWMLPLQDIVVDIYFTSQDAVIINDLNPFGPPTDPLMLNTWNRDWTDTIGIKMVPSPTSVTGSINVSF